jgi:hypothetical protein
MLFSSCSPFDNEANRTMDLVDEYFFDGYSIARGESIDRDSIVFDLVKYRFRCLPPQFDFCKTPKPNNLLAKFLFSRLPEKEKLNNWNISFYYRSNLSPREYIFSYYFKEGAIYKVFIDSVFEDKSHRYDGYPD